MSEYISNNYTYNAFQFNPNLVKDFFSFLKDASSTSATITSGTTIFGSKYSEGSMNCIGYAIHSLFSDLLLKGCIYPSFDLAINQAPVDKFLSENCDVVCEERWPALDYRKIGSEIDINNFKKSNFQQNDLIAIRIKLLSLDGSKLFNYYRHIGIIESIDTITHKPGTESVRHDSRSGFINYMYDELKETIDDYFDDMRVSHLETNQTHRVPANIDDFKFGFVLLRKKDIS